MNLVVSQLILKRQDRVLSLPLAFVLSPGEMLQVTGANGCGKSTLLRMIAGLIEPETGHIQRPDDLHYLGHQNGLKPDLTVWENLQLDAVLLGVKSDKEKWRALLQEAGLAELAERKAGMLSQGQARKLALLRLLLKPVVLWVLDEPDSSLDRVGQEWLQGLIATHRAKGGMVIMATHHKIVGATPCGCPGSNRSDLAILKNAAETKSGQRDIAPGQAQGPAPTFSLLLYDLKIITRNTTSWLTPLLFFIMAITLFSIAAGQNTKLLHAMAPGILWVTALLAILLSIDNLFRPDASSGHLDLILTSPCPVIYPVLSKTLTHWFAYGLPLVLLSPLLGLLLGLTTDEKTALFLSLIIGTPILSLTGAIGAALVSHLRGHGLLLPVLIMPLYIPVLIFGTSSVTAAGLHQPIATWLALLAAFLLFTLVFSPFLTTVGLRTGVN